MSLYSKRDRSIRIMQLYGYARVPTIDWDLRLQRSALQAAGCDVIPAELASGSRKRDPAHFSRAVSFPCCERAGWRSPQSSAVEVQVRVSRCRCRHARRTSEATLP
jgi:hypothetical protein